MNFFVYHISISDINNAPLLYKSYHNFHKLVQNITFLYFWSALVSLKAAWLFLGGAMNYGGF